MSFENNFLKEIISNKEGVIKLGEKMYNLESGVTVKIEHKEIIPKGSENLNRDQAVIFLPGWEAETNDKTTTKLSQEFSDSSGELTHVITADSRKAIADSSEKDMLYEEAIAISKFIKETGSKDIKIVGYSIGGDRAINIASILQEDPEVKIEGLILLASTGLYKQNPRELTTNLVKDSFIGTPRNILKDKNNASNFSKWSNVALDVNLNTIKKIVSSPGHIGQLRSRIREVSELNPRIVDLKIPIVLINGADDMVSSEQKITPVQKDEVNKITLREKYLKENVFKQSPYVKMIVPSKGVSNHGLPFFKSKSVADASLYLLDRFNREK